MDRETLFENISFIKRSPNRFKIMECFSDVENSILTPTQIVEITGIPINRVSHYLKELTSHSFLILENPSSVRGRYYSISVTGADIMFKISSKFQKGEYEQSGIFKPLSKSSSHRKTKKWRDKIVERDKVCQCCGFDKHLEAHHIYAYKDNPSLREEENNGITLCKFCHKKYHSEFGRYGANPKDFSLFMKKYGVKNLDGGGDN